MRVKESGILRHGTDGLPGVVRPRREGRLRELRIAALQSQRSATSPAGILYLDKATFVTGETLHIDGGWAAGH